MIAPIASTVYFVLASIQHLLEFFTCVGFEKRKKGKKENVLKMHTRCIYGYIYDFEILRRIL